MKKSLLLILWLSIILCHPALAVEKYVNGIDPNYPPFAYVDEKTGQPAGFDVDSMNWIAKTMGFEVSHVAMQWDGIIPALLARQIDMVCSGMSITPERGKMVLFSEPYWKVDHVFLARADSSLTPADILANKGKLGVQRGTSEARDIAAEKKEKGYAFELRQYDSAPLAIEDLLNKRIDAAYMDELPADVAIAQGRAVRKAGSHGEPARFGVAVRKDDGKLKDLIDAGYRKLMADPYWMELQKKYLSK